MSYSYATLADTIADTLTEVKSDGQKESVQRLLYAASAFADQFTLRPAGFFSAVGTKQKLNIAIEADDLLSDCVVRLTLTAAELTGSPVQVDVNATAEDDDSDSIAAKFATAIAADDDLSAFFNVVLDGPSLDIEIKNLAAVDVSFAATVDATTAATGIDATASTVVEVGSLSAAAVRRYRGNGKNYLQIGRHVRGTVSVENVGSSLYYEHPENGWLFATDVAGQPGSGYEGDNDYRLQNCNLFAANALYLVTARWGFAETPQDITMAVKQITQHIWDRGKGVIGQISPSGFVVERDIPLTAKAMLTNWIRRDFEVS